MRYKLNAEKVFSDVTDGIAILIDMESGVYYGMNQITSNVYENIVCGVDSDELLSALTAVKDFDKNGKIKYLAFIQKLISKGFITEDTSASAAVHLCFDKCPGDELDFILSEYPDASELLLADPIHQVKAESGWQPGKDALK